MNNCKICGAPCKRKYCSDECAKESLRRSRRKKYRDKHPATELFYVFYDKQDFVRYCGTAKQLVEDGVFPTENAVRSRASKLKSGAIIGGSVTILKCLK